MRSPAAPLLIAALASACASTTPLPSELRIRLDARYRARTVELRHSYFYGELYDDNRKLLLSFYPFADTSHIADAKGRPIHPKVQTGIIPAGTEFVIERLEFPDVGALASRMLTTPRYNPWVYLRPADTTGLPADRPFVAVLPMSLDSEAAVEQALANILAPPGTMKPWLAACRPTVRTAIEHKDIERGMTSEEMVTALGPPMLWLTDTLADKPAQVAWYGSTELWLQDGLLAERRPGRNVESPAPATPHFGPPKAN